MLIIASTANAAPPRPYPYFAPDVLNADDVKIDDDCYAHIEKEYGHHFNPSKSIDRQVVFELAVGCYYETRFCSQEIAGANRPAPDNPARPNNIKQYLAPWELPGRNVPGCPRPH
jgi:hypothetical protein